MGSFGTIPLNLSGDEWQRRMQMQMQKQAQDAQNQQSRAGIQQGFGITPGAAAPGAVDPATAAARAAGFTGSLGPSADPAGDAARAAGFTGSFGNQGGGGYLGAAPGGANAQGWMRNMQSRLQPNPNAPQTPQNPTVGRSLQPSQQAFQGRMQMNPAAQAVQNSYLNQKTVQPAQQPNPAMQAAIDSMRRRQQQRTIPLSR